MHMLICVTFSLLLMSGGWLQLLLVALPGLFCLPFYEQMSGFFEPCVPRVASYFATLVQLLPFKA